MVRVFIRSPYPGKRLLYIAEFLFSRICGIPVSVANEWPATKKPGDMWILYSHETDNLADLIITPIGLLSEQDIREQSITVFQWQDMPVFFKTDTPKIPFDLFSAAFYLLSRYEEYLPFEEDVFHRFPFTDSLAWKHQFLHRPLIDQWMLAFKTNFANYAWPKVQSSFQPSYDIDIAYSFRGKSFWRQIGAIGKDILQGKLENLLQRFRVYTHQMPDPLDVYDQLDQWHQKFNVKPLYFVLLSRGSRLDKNLHPSTPLMQKLISRLKQSGELGIHPSWRSHQSEEELISEIHQIQPVISRQHYIRFQLPLTFRKLIAAGIHCEYSMGYGSQNGFRASTAYPHMWYDLASDTPTRLEVHPFCFMECNARFEQNQTPEQTRLELTYYKNTIRQSGGQFITIWHNFSLGSDLNWKSWPAVYKEFLQEMASTTHNTTSD